MFRDFSDISLNKHLYKPEELYHKGFQTIKDFDQLTGETREEEIKFGRKIDTLNMKPYKNDIYEFERPSYVHYRDSKSLFQKLNSDNEYDFVSNYNRENGDNQIPFRPSQKYTKRFYQEHSFKGAREQPISHRTSRFYAVKPKSKSDNIGSKSTFQLHRNDRWDKQTQVRVPVDKRESTRVSQKEFKKFVLSSPTIHHRISRDDAMNQITREKEKSSHEHASPNMSNTRTKFEHFPIKFKSEHIKKL